MQGAKAFFRCFCSRAKKLVQAPYKISVIVKETFPLPFAYLPPHDRGRGDRLSALPGDRFRDLLAGLALGM